jgi:hypothetical protein
MTERTEWLNSVGPGAPSAREIGAAGGLAGPRTFPRGSVSCSAADRSGSSSSSSNSTSKALTVGSAWRDGRCAHDSGSSLETTRTDGLSCVLQDAAGICSVGRLIEFEFELHRRRISKDLFQYGFARQNNMKHLGWVFSLILVGRGG